MMRVAESVSGLALETIMAAAKAILGIAILAVASCKTAGLNQDAQQVVASRSPAPHGCASVGYLVGRGGGSFGGAYISNEDLVEYALNDLRNQAAGLGANYVQHDPPEMGNGGGTTTTVTISGTAYRCDSTTPDDTASDEGPSGARAARSSAPTAAPKPPPDGAVGFTFGQSASDAEAACTNAGFTWAPEATDHFQCSGTPTDLGLPSDVVLRFCDEKLCAAMVVVHVKSDESAPWIATTTRLRGALVAKYGRPETSEVKIPQDCADGFQACIQDERAAVHLEWTWPKGERIDLDIAKPPTETAPTAIRLVYVKRPDQTQPKLEGL